jgi:branched-chain amino acid transport system permease protein
VYQVLLFALLGLGTGALVAGIALSVVLSHRGSGGLNRAAGATAMVAAYAFWALRTGYFGFALRMPPALLLALAGASAVGVLVEWAVLRPLRAAAPLAKLAASLGVLLTAQALTVLVFGPGSRQPPSVLPTATTELFGVTVPVDRFVLAGIAVAVTAALAALYRWGRFGLATRAAAESLDGAVLAGLSPTGLSLANAALASLVAGLFGILAAPLTQLDPVTLPLQVIPALAAALFARFTALTTACAAALLLGVAQSLMYYASTRGWFPTDHGNALPGVTQLLIFLVILAAMVLRGADLPGRGDAVDRGLPRVPVPRRLAPAAAAWTAGCAVALVVLPYDFRQALTNSLVCAVVLMSVTVITGYAGQISVAQLALSGVAGFALAHAAHRHGLGFPLGPLLATAGATALGLAAAVPALRVRGVSLAIVTLAAASALEQFVFVNASWGGGAGATVGSPSLFGFGFGPDAAFRGLDGKLPSPVFGFAALAVATAAGLYVANLRRTDLGRQLLAVRSNERAAAAAGINVRAVKLTAFGLSSFLAGTAGVLFAYDFGSVSASRYSALNALALISFAYVGGISTVSGAVLGGLLSTEALVPHALDAWFGVSGTWALLAGGLAMIVTLVRGPEGLAGTYHAHRGGRARRARRVVGA